MAEWSLITFCLSLFGPENHFFPLVHTRSKAALGPPNLHFIQPSSESELYLKEFLTKNYRGDDPLPLPIWGKRTSFVEI